MNGGDRRYSEFEAVASQAQEKAFCFPILRSESTGLKIFNVTHSFFRYKNDTVFSFSSIRS